MTTFSTPAIDKTDWQNEIVWVYEQLTRQIGQVLMNKDYERLTESINKMEELIMSSGNQESHSPKHSVPISEWMTLANGAKYAGVSYNTFSKFRLMGLKVSEIEGIKRVSRKEIDSFLESYSF
ncbi:hypothetical protein SAMN05421670_3002 [Psychrobacillus psychrotolerans]|uniref:Helix-turn-helix domain-containing protein n=1 Tax=Psychrobacillus psychrotolerans TaxID=126156 RepID=A0A1I5ZZC9_9BACI|nr:hypothetical protein [Psychrobacillus psychrotolerans]SFQ61819.1 hypothetical protein SAMN05421670_3002 [Psychrobacillus psychrotolerans]